MSASLRTDIPVDTMIAELEGTIPKAMERENVQGLSIAMIRDAKIMWAKG